VKAPELSVEGFQASDTLNDVWPSRAGWLAWSAVFGPGPRQGRGGAKNQSEHQYERCGFGRSP